MAEFLLCAVDVNPAEPAAWTADDIIDVRADGAPWGTFEDYELFIAAGHKPAEWHGRLIIVKVPGMTLEDAKTFRERVVDETKPIRETFRNKDGQDETVEKGFELVANGRFKIDRASLPARVRNELRDGKKATILRAQFLANVLDKHPARPRLRRLVR